MYNTITFVLSMILLCVLWNSEEIILQMKEIDVCVIKKS